MKKCILFVCVSLMLNAPLSISHSAHAQVVPDSYRQQKQQEMLQFADSIHDEFVRYLEHLWTEYQLFEGDLFPLDNKPVQQPQLDTSVLEEDTLIIDCLIQYGSLNTAPQVEEAPFTPPAVSGTAPMRHFVIPFYGRNLSIPLPEKVAAITLSGVRERHVAHFWKKLDENHADQCVASLDQHRRNLYLGDWGLFDLIRHFAATVYPNLVNEQTVFSVFLLDAMHYDARIGRMDNQLVMLVNTGSRLYDVPYVTIDSIRYYAVGSQSRKGRIHTYSHQMAKADKALDMHLPYSPRLGGGRSSKPFSYTLSGHKVEFRVSQPLMDFYALYPQTELPIYASAALEETLAAAIQHELEPVVEEKGAEDALNTLLDFLQHGFSYQTDHKQFGHEKTFFCEENFYYPANDCEDRAILFARMVRQLLGLDVVLLEFDDHVATAVHIPGRKVRGHHLDIQGRRYMVCDPTYIGASVGNLSRKYRHQKANVIFI